MTTDTKERPARSRHTEPPVTRSISINVNTVISAAVIAVLVVAVIALSGLLVAARSDISNRERAAVDDRHAEQVATDYALGSATVKFDDIPAWVGRLKTNASPALAAKFDATAPKLQEILVPLQWNSTATPIAAKVVSESGGRYTVSVFIDVNSTNAQNPAGARSTVTYTVTVDRGAGWQVTDVGGSDGALPLK
ncbi:hypothetical protein [Nocardia sp. XZ_19_385]|uniref:hypothetical protein n=1 Tax=Nocardia sp. XZ_19_385 TaxID=2769488 RepID=UPI001E6394EA|nr:hypothetical protein [Nocardia sp. XZ_19_385]